MIIRRPIYRLNRWYHFHWWFTRTMWLQAQDRWFIFRDTPDWFVWFWAREHYVWSTDLMKDDDPGDDYANWLKQAAEEKALRVGRKRR